MKTVFELLWPLIVFILGFASMISIGFLYGWKLGVLIFLVCLFLKADIIIQINDKIKRLK